VHINRTPTHPSQFNQSAGSVAGRVGQPQIKHPAQGNFTVPAQAQQAGGNTLMQTMSKLVDSLQKLVTEVTAKTSSSKSSVSGNGQFLWKPIAESDGNLVILLPSHLTNDVADVEVRTRDGERLERGRFSGVHNEGREHFRFSKSGANFPAGSQVVIRLKDGSQQTVTVENTGSRFRK